MGIHSHFIIKMPKGSRRRVYVGRLDRRTRARDLEDVFNRYGRIRDLELKRDYAFIVCDDVRSIMNPEMPRTQSMTWTGGS